MGKTSITGEVNLVPLDLLHLKTEPSASLERKVPTGRVSSRQGVGAEVV